MPAAWSTLLLLLFFAAAVVAVSTEETFRKLDKDNSGTLDLQEYRQLASRLQMSVDAIVGDSKEPPASAAEADMRNQDAVGYGGPGFWGGFVSGVGMIMATEIGDKTFFIAAIMAMQYPRILVFAGAIAALAVMTVLSAALGFALPNVLPRQYTHYLGALLFLYFGVKMLKEGFEASGGGPSDELAEVEMELLQSKRESEDDIAESGSGSGPAASHHHNGNSSSKAGSAAAAGVHKDAWAVFTQGFTLTFLAEWGDRSQIATIALAAAKNVVGVTVGGILGHSMCTGLAVVGGRLLAARISEKTVHLVGGALFLVFGLHSLVFGL